MEPWPLASWPKCDPAGGEGSRSRADASLPREASSLSPSSSEQQGSPSQRDFPGDSKSKLYSPQTLPPSSTMSFCLQPPCPGTAATAGASLPPLLWWFWLMRIRWKESSSVCCEGLAQYWPFTLMRSCTYIYNLISSASASLRWHHLPQSQAQSTGNS